MKKLYFLLLFLACGVPAVFAQNVGINQDGTLPNPSAMLDVKSSNRGVLIPRVSTTQRNAISNPAVGLLVFDSTERTLYMFDGHNWLSFAAQTDVERPVSNFVYGPDASDTTLAGYSVSMWDQFAAIGVPYHRVGAIYAGGVYIYRLISGSWQYFTTLAPAEINNFSGYGGSVSLKGNYLLVGAASQLNAGVAVGAAYEYYFNGTAWTLLQTIFGPTAGDNFGEVVAINQFGTYAAVSAPNITAGALANGGQVKVYFKMGSTLSLQASLQDAAESEFEYFGSTMAISPSGNHILVGAQAKTVDGHSGNGYVGQFDRSGTTWSQTHTSTPVSADNLGIGAALDIDDNYAIWYTRGSNKFSFVDLNWSGYDPIAPANVNSVELDVTTDAAYCFTTDGLYSISPNNTVPIKLRSFAVDLDNQGLDQLMSVYNKSYILGFPDGQNTAHPYVGVFYFGLIQ